MKPMSDITGQKYGRLTAIRCLGRRNGQTYWLFKCDCGKEHESKPNHVIKGYTKSCGCWNKERARKGKGESGYNTLLRGYKTTARYRGHCFELTTEEFRNLVTCNCHYCGAPPQQRKYNSLEGSSKEGIDWGTFVYNGIDRVDSQRGYTLDNCVTCCAVCNRAKLDHEIKEFARHVEKMYHFWAKEYLSKL